MSDAIFPAHIASALDRLMVPALPTGFGDRLWARVEAGDLPEADHAAPLPDLRRPVRAAGWRRSGRIVMVVAAFGLATATAAASGVFGDAVYIPVVSDALAKADLVALPRKVVVSKKRDVAAEAVQAPVLQKAAEPLGKDIIIGKMAELRGDPAYLALSPEQKLSRLKVEMADMLASGKVTRADIKAARQQWHEARLANRDARRSEDLPILRPRASSIQKRDAAAPRKRLSPAHISNVKDVYVQLSPEQQSELRDLRQRRRAARPAERSAINEEIRAFWHRAGGKAAAQGAGVGANDAQP